MKNSEDEGAHEVFDDLGLIIVVAVLILLNVLNALNAVCYC